MQICHHESEHLSTAEQAKGSMLREEDIARVSAQFKVMSEPSRLKVLLALRHGELCVYHIVEAVGGTQSAVSHQLRILRDNQIIRARRDGQNILYSLADQHVAQLLDMACEHLACREG